MAEENPTDSLTTERSERNGKQRTTCPTRRRLLCGLVAGASLLAGCSSLAGNDSTDTPTPTTTAGQTTETETQTATPTETGTQTATLTEMETAMPTATTTADSTPTPLPTETALPPQTVTSTTTPLSTRTPVATDTSASTTATPAVTTTPAGTSSSTSTGGVASISPDDLTTFTNSRIGYSIKYPSKWSPTVASVATPSWVSIVPSSGRYSTFTGINIYGYSDLDFSPPTLDAFAAWFEELFQESYDEFEVKRQRTITLPNGNRARVLYVQARVSGFGKFRLTWLFTIVNGTGYAVQVRFPDKAYTRTLKRTIDAIVESFTVKTS